MAEKPGGKIRWIVFVNSKMKRLDKAENAQQRRVEHPNARPTDIGSFATLFLTTANNLYNFFIFND